MRDFLSHYQNDNSTHLWHEDKAPSYITNLNTMGLTYTALEGDEIRLLTILPENAQNKHADEIQCKLDHFSLSKWKTQPGHSRDGGQVYFRGPLKDEAPEYFHVIAQTKSRGIVRSIASSAMDKLRTKMGRPSHFDLLANPERFNFTIRVGQEGPRDRNEHESEPAPAVTPDGYEPRYQWGDFLALSYVWGAEAKQPPQIRVNGELHPVTPNLEAALREIRDQAWFRPRDKGLMLWVDALCINQRDEAEKTVQVMRMHQIYHDAGNVLVWLNEKGVRYFDHRGVRFTSDVAIASLQQLGAYYRTEVLEALDHSTDPIQVHQHRQWANKHLRQGLRMIEKTIRDEGLEEDAWLAVLHFFSNPYWRRLWIIQELAMGRPGMPILCNGRVTHWRHIRDSALIMARVSSLIVHRVRLFAKEHSLTLPEDSELLINHVAAIAEVGIHGQRKKIPPVSRFALQMTSTPGPDSLPQVRGTRLLQIFTLASQARCFKPEDRVWGLVAAPGIRTLEITKLPGMTIAQTYLAFAVHCILSGERAQELESAADDEVMVVEETTTITHNDVVDSSYTTTNEVNRGVTSSLDILSMVNGLETDLSLPSWVPDLNATAALRISPLLGPWCASGLGQGVPQPKFVTLSKPSDSGALLEALTLECLGIVIDEIDGIGAIQSHLMRELRFSVISPAFTKVEFIATRANSADQEQEADDLFHKGVVQATESRLRDDQEVRASIANVLVAGADLNGVAIDSRCLLEMISMVNTETDSSDPVDLWTTDFIRSSAGFCLNGKPLASYFASTIQNSSPDVAISKLAAKHAMAAKTRGRRLATTTINGFLGLVPMATQPGDAVAILIGHGRPVVLRKTVILGRHGVVWRVLGEAYIDGLMEGEAARFGGPRMKAQVMSFI